MSLPVASILIKHASQLVTMPITGGAPKRGADLGEIGLVEDGALAISGERILAAGPTSQVVAQVKVGPETRILEARGRTVLPGFVDPHTHTVFAGWREKEFVQRLQGASYLEILQAGGGILNTVTRTRAASFEELLSSTLVKLDEFLLHGTTTVEIKSGYGLNRIDELKTLEVVAAAARAHPVEVVPTFLGAHAIPPEYRGRAAAYIDFLREEVLPEVAERKLAQFVDVFCEEGVFSTTEAERLLSRARDLGFGLKLHADELAASGGAELAARLRATSADHLLKVSREGIAALAQAGVTAVLLPLTSFFLKAEGFAPARALVEAGVPVALATDFNPGTSPVQSQALSIGLACLKLGLTPAEALASATANAAFALGLGQRVGSLAPGWQADVIVIDAPSYEFIPYRFGTNLVRTVIKKGRIVVEEGRLLPIERGAGHDQ